MSRNKNKIWNVYYYNTNRNVIQVYNIFDHTKFREDCDKIYKEVDTKLDFKIAIQNALRYYFWSKCEWEFYMYKYDKSSETKKIDVYQQVMLNFDIFIDWLWEQYQKS